MTDEQFTTPETTREDWVDVRMQDPDEGEWDVDAVVVEGQVQYVDLRISRSHLSGFFDCLLEDLGAGEAESVLSAVASRNDLDVSAGTEPGNGEEP